MSRSVRMFQLPIMLLAALLLAPGCIIDNSGHSDDPDMTLRLSFEGVGCAQAGIGEVRITFVNPEVASPLISSCLDPMVIRLPEMAPGTYRIRVDAFSAGDPLFVVQSSTFDVVHTLGGTHDYALDLVATTEVLANFTFAGFGNDAGMTCEEAGVETVRLAFDGGASISVPCRTSGRDAAAISNVTPGNHQLRAEGLDASGTVLYDSLFADLPVYPGASNELTLNLLAKLKGGVELFWRFGVSKVGCTQANVDTVSITIAGPDGQIVYSKAVACSTGSLSFPHDDPNLALPAGVYLLQNMVGNSGTTPLFSVTHERIFVPAGRTQLFTVDL